jgi:putative ABC transport system permease protein
VLGTVIGGLVGRWMGGGLLGIYDLFFRFPALNFRMDYSALGIALIVSAAASILGVISVVWMAVKLPPAEAMRPEPPADFKPSLLERLGLTRGSGPALRMALRNIERRPLQALFTIFGLALATGLMVLPGSMADSIDYLLTYQWNDVQRQDVVVFFPNPGSSDSCTIWSSCPACSVRSRCAWCRRAFVTATIRASSPSPACRVMRI